MINLPGPKISICRDAILVYTKNGLEQAFPIEPAVGAHAQLQLGSQPIGVLIEPFFSCIEIFPLTELISEAGVINPKGFII